MNHNLLSKYDLKLSRINRDEIPRFRYVNLINELQGAFKEFIFPELEVSDKRTELITQLWGTGCSESMYIIGCLNNTLNINGDICEFGIAQGSTSALLANEIRNTSKKIWLFDSFKGLPKPTAKDVLLDDIKNLGSIEKYEGTMSHSIDLVRRKLNDISFPSSRVIIVDGYIEETIKSDNLPNNVCFAYVDFDFYEPTKIVLEYLNVILSRGGYIVVDDYEYFSSGVKDAVQEFITTYPDFYEISFPYKFAGKFCIIRKTK